MISFIILLFNCFIFLVLCYNEKISLFENNHPGYLYNLGANSYIGKKINDDENRTEFLVGIVDSPKEAAKLSVVRGSDGRISFSNIILEEEYEKVYNRGYYVNKRKALALTNIGSHPRYTFFPLQQKLNFYFSFSPVVIPEKNAFQIYTRGGCLAVDEMGLLTFEGCIDASTPRKKNQLFRWINQEWYNAGIEKSNSSTPYTGDL